MIIFLLLLSYYSYSCELKIYEILSDGSEVKVENDGSTSYNDKNSFKFTYEFENIRAESRTYKNFSELKTHINQDMSLVLKVCEERKKCLDICH